MISKLTILLFLLPLTFAQSSSCGKQEEVREIFSQESKVELLFFFSKQASDEQKQQFNENVLMRNTDRGQYMREGVLATFGIDRNGYEGIGITFRPEATQSQRESIKRILESSKIVHKIYENVVPNEINDL